MPDSPSGWLRSLAAEASGQDFARGINAAQWLQSNSIDLAVLCADAIDALERIAEAVDKHRFGVDIDWVGEQAHDALARFAALQPDNTEEER